jgi:hypothetical protein
MSHDYSAADMMRRRFAADGQEQCGAPLHGDESTRCLAAPHDASEHHVSEVDAPQLGVERQLIQWNDALLTSDNGSYETQAERNDRST